MSYRRDITVGNIVPSALGGVASALALSYFGVAGSVIGAALGPVVFLLVKELTRGPTEEVVARSAGRRGAPATEGEGGAPPPATRVVVRRRRDLALGALLATAAVSALLAIALITIPELIRGESLVGSGRTTLFDSGGGGSGGAGGGEEVLTETVTAPSTEEEPGTTTAPATETTTTAPAETVPEPPEDPLTTTTTTPPTTTPAPDTTAPGPSGTGDVPAITTQ